MLHKFANLSLKDLLDLNRSLITSAQHGGWGEREARQDCSLIPKSKVDIRKWNADREHTIRQTKILLAESQRHSGGGPPRLQC